MAYISLPESLQFYRQSQGNMEAIDLLVSQLDGRPRRHDDMNWDDLEQYHRALQAAYQTRVDLWVFYQQVWEVVWTNAVQSLSMDEMPAHEYDGARELSAVWNDCYWRTHKIKEGWLSSSVYLDPNSRRFCIAFCFEDNTGSTSLSDELKLDRNCWCADPSESWRYTESGLTEADHERVDVSPLSEAASQAVKSLSECLKLPG